MTACINNFGGFYRTEFYVYEARKHGAMLEGPCIQKGSYQSLLDGTVLILGFNLVRGIEHHTISSIVKSRDDYGCFESFESLLELSLIHI